MTPLTHAIVGTVIYQKLRSPRLGRFAWALAFLLAFASHYILDAIPHFEGAGSVINYRASLAIFLGLGIIGSGLALLLMRWNREAGLLWLILSLWIGLGTYSLPLLRIPTAVLALGYLAYKSKQADALGYLVAGMLAVAADFIPVTVNHAAELHRIMHYQIDWGTRLYLAFAQQPVPLDWRGRLHDPLFLIGYGLEMLVEGVIFFGALYLFSRQRFTWGPQTEQESAVSEPLNVPERS